MEVSALRMHASRAVYADVSLHNALKRMHALYEVSKSVPSLETTTLLQHKLQLVQVELFDDVWGIGRHRSFQNAFEALMLEPQGNPRLWKTVWDKTQDARVTLRQTLFSKQAQVRQLLPFDMSDVDMNASTEFMQTDLPSIVWSDISEPFPESASTPNRQPVLSDTFLDDASRVVDALFSSY